jgi:hypothetical protein
MKKQTKKKREDKKKDRQTKETKEGIKTTLHSGVRKECESREKQ